MDWNMTGSPADMGPPQPDMKRLPERCSTTEHFHDIYKHKNHVVKASFDMIVHAVMLRWVLCIYNNDAGYATQRIEESVTKNQPASIWSA